VEADEAVDAMLRALIEDIEESAKLSQRSLSQLRDSSISDEFRSLSPLENTISLPQIFDLGLYSSTGLDVLPRTSLPPGPSAAPQELSATANSTEQNLVGESSQPPLRRSERETNRDKIIIPDFTSGTGRRGKPRQAAYLDLTGIDVCTFMS
jgi:hypothetical protein